MAYPIGINWFGFGDQLGNMCPKRGKKGLYPFPDLYPEDNIKDLVTADIMNRRG